MTSGFLDESDFSDCLENLGNHLLLSVFKGEGQNRGCSLLIIVITTHWTCQVALEAKNPPASAGDKKTWVQSQGQEDPLKEVMATHSSVPAWRIPWTEEPGGPESIRLQRVRHD